MSGRGRGRGRGRSSGAATQSKLLLKRTAAEAGLDNDRQAVSLQEIVRPSLFPDMLWHSAGGRAVVEKDVLLVKQEETSEDPPDSAAPAAEPSNVDNGDINGDVKTETLDTEEVVVPLNKIKRSSNVMALMNKQRDLWCAFSKSSHYIRPAQHVDVVRYSATRPSNNNTRLSLVEDERYVPTELLRQRSPTKTTAGSMLDAENADDPSKNSEQAEEGDEALNEEVQEVEDDDEVEDYTTNYYASDDDDDDGSGGEATF